MSELSGFLPAFFNFVVGFFVGLALEVSNVAFQRRSQKKAGQAETASFDWYSFVRNWMYSFIVASLISMSATLAHLKDDYAEHVSKDPMVQAEESVKQLGDASLFPYVVAGRLVRTRSMLESIRDLRMDLNSPEEAQAAWDLLASKASTIVEVRNQQHRVAAGPILSAGEIDALRTASKAGTSVSVLVLMGSGSAASPPATPFTAVEPGRFRWVELDRVAKLDGYSACTSVLGSMDFTIFDESVALLRSFSASGVAGGVVTASREAQVTPGSRCFETWFSAAVQAAP